jgi:predicted ATP-dependent endonuclease of OLD family
MRRNIDLILDSVNISEIESYYLENEDNQMYYLPNINEINIIIGSNNSGKSRFMRYLMKSENLKGVVNLIEVNNKIDAYNSLVERFNNDIQEYINEYNNYSRRTIIVGEDEERKKRDDFEANKLTSISNSNYSIINEKLRQNENHLNLLRKYKVSDSQFKNFTILKELIYKEYSNFKSYYIPTLRSAHSLFHLNDGVIKKIEDDIYLETLYYHYELRNSKVEIFTGLHLYNNILNTRNSKKTVRSKFEEFEKFIGEYFFENKKIDIVAEFDKSESLKGINLKEIISVHFENETETRDIHHLGDGIQAIIILMYQIFMCEDNSFLFIDEPELNLHPGMQRLFLEQISSNEYLKNKNLKYFISTHSNHFLDLTLDKENISIYSFASRLNSDKSKSFIIKNVNRGDNSLLKNLGVNNSSVFLANCSIWVEGVSDRNYIKAFLKSYIDYLGKEAKVLKEDIDYAFFEYAGSNIEHYFFEDVENYETNDFINKINALAVSNRIFLLADSDCSTKTSKKGQRLKSLVDSKSDNFFPYIIWNIREIENLLTKGVWKEVLITMCNKELIDKNETEIQSKIDMTLEKIDISDFNKEYIGKFLNKIDKELDKFGKTKIFNTSSYKKISDDCFGTLVKKREVSESVLEKNFDWSVFSESPQIVKITKSIYDFITSNKY